MEKKSSDTPETAGAAKPAKEKTKVLAYVNWETLDKGADGKAVLRSNRGFSLLDNKYLNLEEKALIQLAEDNGGVALIDVELRIVIAQERPDSIETAGITVKNKAA